MNKNSKIERNYSNFTYPFQKKKKKKKKKRKKKELRQQDPFFLSNSREINSNFATLLYH